MDKIYFLFKTITADCFSLQVPLQLLIWLKYVVVYLLSWMNDEMPAESPEKLTFCFCKRTFPAKELLLLYSLIVCPKQESFSHKYTCIVVELILI